MPARDPRPPSRPPRPSSVFANEPIELDVLERHLLATLHRQLAADARGPNAGGADAPRLTDGGPTEAEAGADAADREAAERLIRVVLLGSAPMRCVRAGGQVWTVEHRPPREVFVACYRLERSRRGCQVRRQEERDGADAAPSVSRTCPLAFLAAASETHSAWRREVRSYHERQIPTYQIWK